MRILHICQRDDPDTGGSLRVAEALVREQRRAGVEVWLLFLYGGPAEVARSLEPQVVCLGLHSSRQVPIGVPRLCMAIRRIRPDIIHTHDGITWPRLAYMHFRIPVVMHSHLPFSSTGGPVAQMLIKKTTDILIGISLHTIDIWVEAGFPPSKTHYVPNGVDFSRFDVVDPETKREIRRQRGIPEDKRVLLWVGRLHRSMKGSDRVERVAAALPDDTVLVVVGNGPEFQGMSDRCRQQLESGRLIMAGSTSHPEQFYQAADAFLFTSYHEPFGLVILEAIASGLPIVAFPVTRGGGAVELLKDFHAASLDDGMGPDDIHRQLEGLFSQYGFVQENREHAHRKYAWPDVSSRVVEIYELALNQNL